LWGSPKSSPYVWGEFFSGGVCEGEVASAKVLKNRFACPGSCSLDVQMPNLERRAGVGVSLTVLMEVVEVKKDLLEEYDG
jgi:hypothetical protein